MSAPPLRRMLPLLAAAGLLTACEPVEEPVRPVPEHEYVAPLPEPPRSTGGSEGARWMQAWQAVRGQLDELRTRLAAAQQIHMENHFDEFLQMDPRTLDADQVSWLSHFLERGYFRVERQVLLHLLERRAARQAAGTERAGIERGEGAVARRLQAAMQEDELVLVDLESALQIYQKPDTSDFPATPALTEAQLIALRGRVAVALTEEREVIAGLDAKISALKETLGITGP